MGNCAFAKTNLSSVNNSSTNHSPNEYTSGPPRKFNVCNVDERGNEINFGKIEITDTDLILHQKGKHPIHWPLRSLRRYGFDAQLFSFECGRRCQTGQGIYAFKCSEAEDLFNVLSQSIQKSSQNNALSGLLTGDNSATPPPEPGPRHPRLNHSPPHPYSNSVHEYINSPFYVNTANSHLSSTHVQSLPTTTRTDINTNYAKIEDLVGFDYVNINTPIVSPQSAHKSPPNSPTTPNPEPVNYIMLDLDANGSTNTSGPTIVQTAPATPISKTPTMDFPTSVGQIQATTPPATPTYSTSTVPQQYATIDFEKTTALSNSVNHRNM